jgi:hypothetical protein
MNPARRRKMLTQNSHATSQLPPDRRKPHASHARAVGSFIPKLAAKAFEKNGFHSADIMTGWRDIVGQDLAAATAPERLKWPRQAKPSAEDPGSAAAATLILRVDASQALEIQYRTGEIIDRINRYFGYRAVAALKIVQAQMSPGKPDSATVAAAAPQPVPAPPPLAVPSDSPIGAALTALWSNIASKQRR